MNMFVKALIATPLALLAFAGDSQAQFGWGGGRSGSSFNVGGRNGLSIGNSSYGYGSPFGYGNAYNGSNFSLGGRNGLNFSNSAYGNPYFGGQGSSFGIGGLNFGSSSYGSPYGYGTNSYSTPWGGLSVPSVGGYGYNSGYSSGYYPSSGYSSGYSSPSSGYYSSGYYSPSVSVPSYSSGTVIGGYSSGTPVYSSAGTIVTGSSSATLQMPSSGIVQASGTASGSGKYTVVVPDKAQVWFNGTKSTQTGTRHDFSFNQGGQVTIKVKWMNGSQEMTKEMMVNVNPGEESTIDLTHLLN